MKKLIKALARCAPDAAVLLGVAAVTVGAAMLSVSAGCIVGGALLIALGILGGGSKK